MAGRVNEKSSSLYTAQLVDENNANILLSSLATLTLTLYDKLTGTIINSRDAVNALNANNVAVSSTGLVTYTMLPADNAVVNIGDDTEVHVILFQGTYGAGAAKALKHEYPFRVVNLSKVS